jgi:hypothetical protein
MDMKAIVLLCGSNEVGKTKTLKAFFGVSHIERLKPMQLLERILNGMKIYAVSLNSPQEQSEFCNVSEVKARIEKRIQKCEEASHGQDYILIIPFGIYQKGRRKTEQLNEKCILEPIEWLKKLGFKVRSIYLRKETARLLPLKDELMKKITSQEIKSEKNYDRQAKELESFIEHMS